MSDDEYKGYLEGRYSDLVRFYDQRSKSNKRWHRVCSVFIIAVSGGLAPLIATGYASRYPMFGGLLSASVVVAAAINSHFQFNENWLSYRKTWDALKREVHFHDARIGEYRASDDPNCLFVGRVESIASDEGMDWYERHVKTQEQTQGLPSKSDVGGAAGGS